MCQACRDRTGVWRKGKDKIQGQEISSICRTLAALLSSCPQHGRILRVQAQEICKWETKSSRRGGGRGGRGGSTTSEESHQGKGCEKESSCSGGGRGGSTTSKESYQGKGCENCCQCQKVE